MKSKSYLKRTFLALLVMAFWFFATLVFTVLYMAKDNNYYNTIYQYFNISKEVHNWLLYIDIDKEIIVNGMNTCSIGFMACNYIFTKTLDVHSDSKITKYMEHYFIANWIFQLIIYNTYFYTYIYYGNSYFLIDAALIRRSYNIIHQYTVFSNAGCFIYGLSNIIRADFHQESIKVLKAIKYYMVLLDCGICILYFYMFYSLPDSFLWISRVLQYQTYESLDMMKYYRYTIIIPYVIIVLMVILVVYLNKYEEIIKKIDDDEYTFSSIIASSEVSTRAFSHYIKNEILGVIAEIDWINDDKTHLEEGLSCIKNNCVEIYERLDNLQSMSNRIVLNQSLQNILEIIETSLESMQAIFKEQEIQIEYDYKGKSALVFCDEYFLKEVFKNLFLNAVEAMESNNIQDKKLKVIPIITDKWIELKIRDTGPGIQASIMENIFAPFVSTKSTKINWGIGLSFAKSVVNSHMGKLEARNYSLGAEFVIYLPIIQKRNDRERIKLDHRSNINKLGIKWGR